MVTAEREVRLDINLRGDNWRAYNSTALEILIEGPARTGKTFMALLRMVRNAQNVSGYRGLIVRKVAATLGSTVLTTLHNDVFHEWEANSRRSDLDHVHFFGGSQSEPAAYEFENGSTIVIGGMDVPSKILGSEYDEIFFNQAEEAKEEDIETLLTRLSHGLLEHPALLCDCNPSYDRHFLLKRAQRGQMAWFKSKLVDNPGFYDDDGHPTARGQAYIESIAGTTGTRYQRLVLGEWVGMENAIYPQLERVKHVRPIPENTQWSGRAITGVDYGTTKTHPSTVVTITQASTGVWWVRACWVALGGNTAEIEAAVRAHRVRFKSTKVITDPTLKAYADVMGWTPSNAAAGSRKARIGMVTELLDADAFCIDEYGDGCLELFDEMCLVRYEVKETETAIEDVVVRKDDDRTAGLEYAVEGAKTSVNYAGVMAGAETVLRKVRIA